jgi:methylglyoxal reductase
VQVYSPLEQGLLTGTIGRDYVPGGARANKVWFQRENMLRVMDMLEEWRPLCKILHDPRAGAGVDFKTERLNHLAEWRNVTRASSREY